MEDVGVNGRPFCERQRQQFQVSELWKQRSEEIITLTTATL